MIIINKINIIENKLIKLNKVIKKEMLVKAYKVIKVIRVIKVNKIIKEDKQENLIIVKISKLLKINNTNNMAYHMKMFKEISLKNKKSNKMYKFKMIVIIIENKINKKMNSMRRVKHLVIINLYNSNNQYKMFLLKN